MIVYHGTHEPDAITLNGFRLPERYCHDALGRGIYTNRSSELAARHGYVLECELDTTSYAVVSNPYFRDGWGCEIEPRTEAELLFHVLAFRDGKMLTMAHDCLTRLQAAKRIQEAMLSAGFTGLITQYRGACVTYDPDTIRVRGARVHSRIMNEKADVWRVL